MNGLSQQAWINQTFNRRIRISRIEKEEADTEANYYSRAWPTILVLGLAFLLAISAFPRGLIAAIIFLIIACLALVVLPAIFRFVRFIISIVIGEGLIASLIAMIIIAIPVLIVAIAAFYGWIFSLMGVTDVATAGEAEGAKQLYLDISLRVVGIASIAFMFIFPVTLYFSSRLRKRANAFNQVDLVNEAYSHFAREALAQLQNARKRGGVFECDNMARGGSAAHYAVTGFTGKEANRVLTLQIHNTLLRDGDFFVIDDAQNVRAVLSAEAMQFMEDYSNNKLGDLAQPKLPKWYRAIPDSCSGFLGRIVHSHVVSTIAGWSSRKNNDEDIQLGRI